MGLSALRQDITDQNLPQEIGRDASAISFTKGCYLGQETVARIDALGHVNKMLVGVRFDGATVPQPGEELVVGGQKFGQVTSAAYSPHLGGPLALAYCTAARAPRAALTTAAGGEATVVALCRSAKRLAVNRRSRSDRQTHRATHDPRDDVSFGRHFRGRFERTPCQSTPQSI